MTGHGVKKKTQWAVIYGGEGICTKIGLNFPNFQAPSTVGVSTSYRTLIKGIATLVRTDSVGIRVRWIARAVAGAATPRVNPATVPTAKAAAMPHATEPTGRRTTCRRGAWDAGNRLLFKTGGGVRPEPTPPGEGPTLKTSLAGNTMGCRAGFCFNSPGSCTNVGGPRKKLQCRENPKKSKSRSNPIQYFKSTFFFRNQH